MTTNTVIDLTHYLSFSILHHQWQTESGLTRRPAVGRSSHYSFVFEDSLSTRPVQDGHRKTDWPSEKQCFLYDVGHNNYRNVVKKAEAWRDIAKEVNQDGMYYFFINYFIFAH